MDSLVPILESIPSELIVVDTGGTDGAIEIAKQYADIIVPFKWCNDFAKARNAGLEKAKGEWFLFLDDDEWFENVDEIIEFFSSKEYLNYNCASYAIRNYKNKEGTEWSESRYHRMAKLMKETKFISPIHEILSPTFSPEKYLNCYVHHYGYVYDSEEERQKHADRNITLLTEVLSLKDTQDRHRLKVQLAQEYGSIREYKTSLDISKKDIEDIDALSIKMHDNITYAGWHMKNVVYSEIYRENRKEAFCIGKNYLEKKWINTVTKNNLTNALTRLAFEFKEYKECIRYLEVYLETYNKIIKDEQLKLAETIADQSESYQEDNYYLAVLSGFKAAYQLNNYEKKKKYIEKLSKIKYIVTEVSDMTEIVNYILELSNKQNRKQLLERFLYNEKFRILLTGIIEDESDLISNKEIIDILAEHSKEYPEFLPYKIISLHRKNKEINSLIDEYYTKENNILYPNIEWIDIFVNKIDILEYLNKISLEQWIKNINSFVKKASIKTIKKVIEVFKINEQENVKLQNLLLQSYEKMLVSGEFDKMKFDELDSYLKGYIDINLRLFHSIYKNEVFTCELEIFLADGCRFCNKIKDMYLEGMDELSKVRIIREAVDLYPHLSPFCKIYNEKMQEESKKATKEFLQLAEIIKENIRRYIVLGQSETALNTLYQLEQLVPNDPEVLELKQLLL